ncbi:YALIA101S01e26368g1_1 [Yarrowia lipolytica]|nr:YALIA101S01e26368g1_1 [Yarrowia lipolytica]
MNGNGRQPVTYRGYNTTEMTRLLLQALGDLGYKATAETLESESNISLESPHVAQLRQAVTSGQWDDAERYFDGVTLRSGTNPAEYRFLIRKQHCLELLAQGDDKGGLRVLREELAPLGVNTHELAVLSNHVFETRETVLRLLDGDAAKSRVALLTQLQAFIAPSEMIPEYRLATLLSQAQQHQVAKAAPYHMVPQQQMSLFEDYKGQPDLFPDRVSHVLEGHSHEVWNLEFSHCGKFLASVSCDKSIIIWNLDTYTAEKRLQGHSSAPVMALWSPDDSMILSGSQDKTARLWNAKTGEQIHVFEGIHAHTVSCAWLPDGKRFITSCADDATMILWSAEDCTEVHRWKYKAIHAAVSPDGKRLVAVGGPGPAHNFVVFDLVTFEEVAEVATSQKTTSVSISADSRYALINFMGPKTGDGVHELQLWDICKLRLCQRYIGNSPSGCVIRSCFGGIDDSLVLSGSEDSRVYVWNRADANLIAILQGHSSLVNCVQWHPTRPMFASAGDDHTVRIWDKEQQ